MSLPLAPAPCVCLTCVISWFSSLCFFKRNLCRYSLAEERAVQMAAECETLREEKDAIAAALDFVNGEMEALRYRTEAAEDAVVGLYALRPVGLYA